LAQDKVTNRIDFAFEHSLLDDLNDLTILQLDRLRHLCR
jgi:hypothetical protein